MKMRKCTVQQTEKLMDNNRGGHLTKYKLNKSWNYFCRSTCMGINLKWNRFLKQPYYRYEYLISLMVNFKWSESCKITDVQFERIIYTNYLSNLKM